MNCAEGVNYKACLAQGLKEKKLVESNLEKVDRLKPIAQELDCTLAQLALAWCIRNEHVSSVITGATKREQVKSWLSLVAHVSMVEEQPCILISAEYADRSS